MALGSPPWVRRVTDVSTLCQTSDHAFRPVNQHGPAWRKVFSALILALARGEARFSAFQDSLYPGGLGPTSLWAGLGRAVWFGTFFPAPLACSSCCLDPDFLLQVIDGEGFLWAPVWSGTGTCEFSPLSPFASHIAACNDTWLRVQATAKRGCYLDGV